MDTEVSKNNEQVNESPMKTLASEKPFNEHMKDVEKRKLEQELKAETKQIASEYEITEYDRSLLSDIDNIEDNHDRELALVGFGYPLVFKPHRRGEGGFVGIEEVAVECANRADRNISTREYLNNRITESIKNKDMDMLSKVEALNHAERILSTPQEERDFDEGLIALYALELAKQVLARNKGE